MVKYKMNVFVVSCCNFNRDITIIGVFSSEEKAKEVAEEWWDSRHPCIYKEEYVDFTEITIDKVY
jgi:hypothetical protein